MIADICDPAQTHSCSLSAPTAARSASFVPVRILGFFPPALMTTGDIIEDGSSDRDPACNT